MFAWLEQMAVSLEAEVASLQLTEGVEVVGFAVELQHREVDLEEEAEEARLAISAGLVKVDQPSEGRKLP